MANVFISLPVPVGDGVGAWVDVSAQGPERTISVDGGAFGGDILIEGSNDAQASAIPAAVGPFPGPTFVPQTFLSAFNFLRVRRRNSGGAGTPTVNLAAPAAVANIFGAMAVPAAEGVGAAIDISGGGDINTFSVSGAVGGQILIETSTDGVNFSPTLLFTDGGGIPQQVTGVLSAARVRRRPAGTAPQAAPLVSVGSQATSGAAGGGFPGYGGAPPSIAAASAGGASALVSRADHTHAGVGSAIAGAGIGVSGPTGAVTFTNTGVTSNVAGAGISVSGPTGAVTIANTGVTSAIAGAGISVSGPTGAVTIGNTGVTSLIAGAGIAISGATGNVTVSATGGAFPGFGGAPPAVASVSAAGASGLAAQSDHTHGLDLVTYTPSVAGMQVAGVIQQTFPNPTAVPAAFNVGADRLAYGAHAATGLLSTSASLLFNDSNSRFAVLGAGSTATAATIPIGQGFFQADTNALVTVEANSSAAVGTSPTVRIIRTRGTFAAQTVVGALDIIGSIAILSHDGTSQKQPMSFNFTVDGAQPVSLGKIPVNGTWIVNPDTIGVGPVPVVSVSWAMDIVLGNRALATNATAGFMYPRSMAGVPSGVPAIPSFVDNNVNTAASGPPSVVDTSDRRQYSYIGGAWHYAQLMDYDPTVTRVPFGGATTHTLVDSANFFFTTGTNTLSVPVVSAVGAGSLTLQTAATVITLANGPTQATINGDFVPTADNTMNLGGPAAAWNMYAATLTRAATACTLNFSNVSGANAMSIQTATTSSFRISHAGGTFPILWESNTTGLGLFGVAPAGQAVGGALAAGVVYTATEQSMLNKAYGALRTFGLLS